MPEAANPGVELNTAILYDRSYHELAVRNDRLFARLLMFEWVAGVGLALWIAPRAYAGTQSSVHIHLYAAIYLGFAVVSLPLALIRLSPGKVLTRHIIAVAQMVMAGLLIDLTGGRIETHFLIFGSLAFLAFYTDWRVIVTASAITAADHLLRGFLLPRSIYGVDVVNSWRWLEHAGYVLFEDLFLIPSCVFGVHERWTVSRRQAELESTKSDLLQMQHELERRVETRTGELRNSNLALQAAKESADMATRSKSEFLANMSHEIRTPITAIVGFADMMMDPDQTQLDRMEAPQAIRRNARHLLELINDILDLSKIEAGRMTVENIAAELPPILSEVLSMMRPRAVEKGLDLTLRFTGRVPKKIVTDPIRVKQILINLVSNALKFTQKGQVELHIFATPSSQALNFEVTDSGIGLSEGQIGRLFQPFTQADGSTTRRFGGTGLGLMISKRLAQMIGGDISIRSQPGVGSTFAVVLSGAGDGTGECCNVQDALVVPQSSADLPFKTLCGRVLLAEDGKDNQRFISAMLRKTGLEVVLAANGRIAVERALAESFDVILMDMQMPELDGYAATSMLRRENVMVPIIALTAHAMADDRSKCIQAGCTDYLTKPIDRRLLIDTVARHLDPAALPPQLRQVSAAPPASSAEIVSACENDTVMADVLPEFLAGLPNEVAALTSLMDEQDLSSLREALHQLRGAGGSYGFQCLSDAAAVAEKSLNSDAPIETVRSQVELLIGLIQRVKGFSPAPEAAR